MKCLQEDATISQVSWEYILQCNIGEVWGRRFSELGCRSDTAPACPFPGSTRTRRELRLSLQGAKPSRSRLVCLRTDSHTQPPRQTNGGQAAALAWGLATPRAMRVSVRCGVRCLSANKLKRTSHLLSSSRGHRTRWPLCSDSQGLLKGGDVWVQVC